DRLTAHAARFAGAFVDVELLAEVARIAVRADVIAQRRATDLHRQGQGRLDRTRQSRALLPLERSRLAAWSNASTEQCLAGVDVSHAHDQPGIHDQLFDRRGTAPRDL